MDLYPKIRIFITSFHSINLMFMLIDQGTINLKNLDLNLNSFSLRKKIHCPLTQHNSQAIRRCSLTQQVIYQNLTRKFRTPKSNVDSGRKAKTKL